MKESKLGELILALFFLGFFVVLTLISMTYSPNARRVPLIVTIPGIALSAAQSLKTARRFREAARAPSAQEEQPGDPDRETTDEKKKILVMFGWMFLLIGMIWTVGFLVTIPVYTAVFMRSLKESWRLSILFGVVGFAVLYFLFVWGLNMDLYPGLIFQPW